MTPFESVVAAALNAAPVVVEHGVDRAFLAGSRAERIGAAFVEGYTEALHALLRNETFHRAAFAVTEDGGGHPAAIQTKLTWLADGSARLDGSKSFVTLGDQAERVFVVASEGQDGAGKNQLRLVGLDRAALTMTPGPQLPMMPEVRHERLVLDGVPVAAAAVLPGDAYLTYVKPFRTVEDIHVHTAIVGHMVGLARRFALPHALTVDLLATFAALRALALEPPLSPSTHLALGGVLAGFERLLVAHADTLRQLPTEEHARFERDIALRLVAAKARAQRLTAALAAYR